MAWTLTDAKNRLSEVLDRVESGDPQLITRRGREFVLVDAVRYRELVGKEPTLLEFLVGEGPRLDEPLDTRIPDDSPTRDPLSKDDDQAAA